MCPDHPSYPGPRGEKFEILALVCHVIHPKKSSRERKSGMIDSGKNRNGIYTIDGRAFSVSLAVFYRFLLLFCSIFMAFILNPVFVTPAGSNGVQTC
ncbi:hypothetical protein CEXT_472031 [Caerostris extrusa]|uniref:Uncharacterized protein n=1 Tax=Caerostris extrusa TaxID=172846 RepID=A0AAV4T4F2_CAEEX|nr:hypothetical protein CEXT_472031 [Caerostris extrusa]